VPTVPEPLRRNAYSLYADVFWYGVLAGSSIAFLPVYAVRIGATAFLIGLLTSGPAVVNLLASLPAAHWLERRSVIRVTYLTSIWHRVGFLLLIPLPLFLPAAYQVWAMPLIVVAMAVPGTLLAIAFNAVFADVIPPEWRGHVVGRRNVLLSISLTATSLGCGQLLDRIAFPLNYQIVFALGALGAAMSTYYLGRIRALNGPPPRVGQPVGDVAASGQLRFGDTLRQPPGLRFLTRGAGRALFRLDLLRGSFGPFMLAYFLFYTFQYLIVPIVPLFWVHELHLSGGAIGLGSGIFYLVMLLFSTLLARVSRRLGHRRVLALGAMFYCAYPLLHSLARDATLFWVASAMGGGAWALANGGLVNRLMERVPEGDRPAHMALHNLALNLGILCGSVLGPLLGDRIGLRDALLVGGVLRFLGGIALGVWG
jgi:MFS transporter